MDQLWQPNESGDREPVNLQTLEPSTLIPDFLPHGFPTFFFNLKGGAHALARILGEFVFSKFRIP